MWEEFNPDVPEQAELYIGCILEKVNFGYGPEAVIGRKCHERQLWAVSRLGN
jgi:hypothetical protein